MEIGRFDSNLHQFIENPPINMKRLVFERFLREREGRTLSAPCGDLALAEAVTYPKAVVRRTIVEGD